uniref:Uncharacterized protein n=1 Tax=Arundo donax TaxID=35708 RepID=A0A0A9CAH5_ARUDO
MKQKYDKPRMTCLSSAAVSSITSLREKKPLGSRRGLGESATRFGNRNNQDQCKSSSTTGYHVQNDTPPE